MTTQLSDTDLVTTYTRQAQACLDQPCDHPEQTVIAVPAGDLARLAAMAAEARQVAREMAETMQTLDHGVSWTCPFCGDSWYSGELEHHCDDCPVTKVKAWGV